MKNRASYEKRDDRASSFEAIRTYREARRSQTVG